MLILCRQLLAQLRRDVERSENVALTLRVLLEEFVGAAHDAVNLELHHFVEWVLALLPLPLQVLGLHMFLTRCILCFV